MIDVGAGSKGLISGAALTNFSPGPFPLIFSEEFLSPSK